MTVLYDMGPLYQWKFAAPEDHTWMAECKDPNLDKETQGEDFLTFSEQNVTDCNSDFIWQHYDLYPDEPTPNYALREPKHGFTQQEIIDERVNFTEIQLGTITVERSTGNRIGYQWWVWVKATEDNKSYWGFKDTHLGKWFSMLKAFGIHPDHRGQHHREKIDLFSRNGFLDHGLSPYTDNKGGYIWRVDAWEMTRPIGDSTVEYTNTYKIGDTVYNTKMEHVLALGSRTAIATGANQRALEQSARDGMPADFYLSYHNPLLGEEVDPWQLYGKVNTITDLSLDPDTGKIYYNGAEQDDTKTVNSVRPWMINMYPGSETWINETFF